MRTTLRLFIVASAFFYVCASAQDQASANNAHWLTVSEESSLYVKVRLERSISVSKIEAGDEVVGELLQPVYSGTKELFPASSRVRLVVDHLDVRRRVPNDHWPEVIKIFTPRHEKYPVFRSASVTGPDGQEALLQVSPISVGNEVEVEPKASKRTDSASLSAPRRKTRRKVGTIITMLAKAPDTTEQAAPSSPGKGPVTVLPGTEAKVMLLQEVRASKDRAGSLVRARLIEPVQLSSNAILPEGTLFEGKVLKSQAPRTLSRSGSVLLGFTNMRAPGNLNIPVAASVAGAEIHQRSHMVIDAEGRMHGDRTGTTWMIVDAGFTAGIAKEVDDGTQLLIEALISSATDASTAGTAKIVSTCVSGIFLLTRHGRDVVLPKYTQMKIVFDRPTGLATPNPIPTQ